jgi:hypothetical protein
MKPKAAERPTLTKSPRMSRLKPALGAGAGDRVSRVRPFLVHTLGLRSRKPER